MCSRQRFYVELKPGETTFVSWKKLVKVAHNTCYSVQAPFSARAPLEGRMVSEVSPSEKPLNLSHNHLGSVIENIDRLYRGESSGSEKEGGHTFLNDGYYDTHDSFIDDKDLDDYFSMDGLKIKHEGFFVNRGRLEYEQESFKKVEMMTKKLKSGDRVEEIARSPESDCTSRGHERSQCISTMAEQLKKEQRKDSNQDSSKQMKMMKKTLKSGGSMEVARSVSVKHFSGISLEPETKATDIPKDIAGFTNNESPFSAMEGIKNVTLESALLDLERGVVQICPPLLFEREQEQGKRNRLPNELKQKLAKVARLAAKRGGLTSELIERLMGSLGHMMQEKTLKKNVKKMMETGASAMQNKMQNIKREITEMLSSRLQSVQIRASDQQGTSDGPPTMDSSLERATADHQYRWDEAIEDKLCDLCEQFTQGLDESRGRGPQIRKVYAEVHCLDFS